MRPNATIYKSGKSPKSGEFVLELSKVLKGIYLFLRLTGIVFVLISLGFIVITFGPLLITEAKYYMLNLESKPKIDYSKHIVDSNYTMAIQEEAKSFGVNSYFAIVVPKIGAVSNITPNVDSSVKSEYLEALSKGVAHAKGTSFPGSGSRVFLFSHSTDTPLNFAKYNAVFYLLKKLEPKDQIIVYYADKRYLYEVIEQKTTTEEDTSWIEPNEGKNELVLMTCDPPGTTWNRLLIIAKPLN